LANVDLSTMPCTEGFSFTGGTYSLAVTASNFANQQTQAFFSFQVAP